MAQRGVTMVEVFVAMTIGALVLLIAVPAFTTTIRRSRLDSATRRIVSEVREARARSVSTGWEYAVVGFGSSSAHARRNQFRRIGRVSSATAWPADSTAAFTSTTQMAEPWIDVSESYADVALDPSGSSAQDRFSVAFDSRGGVAAQSGDFAPFLLRCDGRSGGFRLSATGSVVVE